MNVLRDGIYAMYDGNATLKTALAGGMHFEEAPQGTAFPYGTFHLIHGVPVYTFTEESEVWMIQFSLFSESSSATEVETAYTALTALYDHAESSLSVTGYSSTILERDFQDLYHNDTDDFWQYSVGYTVRIQKD